MLGVLTAAYRVVVRTVMTILLAVSILSVTSVVWRGDSATVRNSLLCRDAKLINGVFGWAVVNNSC